jgi:beta-N-acetylhexosaminidase
MTAHISYPKIINDNTPATLSKYFLSDILRKKMKFSGIIITDDMEMHAISRNYGIGKAAVMSIKAGTDIVLISSNGKSIGEIVATIKSSVDSGELSLHRIDESVTRIIETKLRYHIMDMKDNKIIASEPEYSADDLKLLQSADSINKEVTRKAIYAHHLNRQQLMEMTARKTVKIVVTGNRVIAAVCRNLPDNSCVVTGEGGMYAAIAAARKKLLSGGKLALFYHVNSPVMSHIRNAEAAAYKYNASICLLSTGNPFPLSQLKSIPPVIYSFSNTEESLKQVAECITGKYLPKFSIKFSLGFPE